MKDTAHNLVFNVEYIDINDSEIFTSESLTISLPVIKAVETFNLIDLELSGIPGKDSNSMASSVTGGKINQINVLVKNLADAGAKVVAINYHFDKPDHQTKNLVNYKEYFFPSPTMVILSVTFL